MSYANSTTGLDTALFKDIFLQCNILDKKSYIKRNNNFEYLYRNNEHNPTVLTRFIKDECIRYLKSTNYKWVPDYIFKEFKVINKREATLTRT